MSFLSWNLYVKHMQIHSCVAVYVVIQWTMAVKLGLYYTLLCQEKGILNKANSCSAK